MDIRMHRQGEKHPLSKLTAQDVLKIRARHIPANRNHGAAAISRDYRVNKRTISDLISGKNWGWLK